MTDRALELAQSLRPALPHERSSEARRNFVFGSIRAAILIFLMVRYVN